MRKADRRPTDSEIDRWFAAANPGRTGPAGNPAADRLQQNWRASTALRRRRTVACRRSAAAGLLVAVIASLATLHATRSQKILTDSSLAPERSADSHGGVLPTSPPDTAAPTQTTSPTEMGLSESLQAPRVSAEPIATAEGVRPEAMDIAAAIPGSPVAKPATSPAAAQWVAAVSDWSARLDRVLVAADRSTGTISELPVWQELVLEVRASSPAEQKVLVAVTPYLETPAQRTAAVALVAAAGESSAVPVLEQWLADRSLRSTAFDQLARIAADRDLPLLAAAAQSPAERDVFCRQLVDTRAVEVHLRMLLALAPDSRWRGAVHGAAADLSLDALDGLLTRVRHGNTQQRAAGLLLISAVRHPELDQALAQRVLSGRDRHAAYLALLARPTDEARLFLATAARRWDLSPGLQAAHHGWSRVRPVAERWSQELRGDSDARQPENTSTGDAAASERLAVGRGRPDRRSFRGGPV